MTIWAMGKIGERARFIEATDPAEILGYMERGDQCAPVSADDKSRGGLMLGAMQFRTFTDEELAEFDRPSLPALPTMVEGNTDNE